MTEFNPDLYDEYRTDLPHISDENLANMDANGSPTKAKAIADEKAERKGRAGK